MERNGSRVRYARTLRVGWDSQRKTSPSGCLPRRRHGLPIVRRGHIAT
jgi:hypothetical protein